MTHKWEYIAFQVTIIPLKPLRITVESEDEALIESLRGKSGIEGLNYLGEQGWELVTAIAGLEKSSQIFYFKRPKQDVSESAL